MKFCRECLGSFVGFFGRLESTSTVVANSAVFDPCDEALAFLVPRYSLEPRRVVFLRSAIPMILRRRSVSQVAPSIVRLVFIFVVYFVFGPRSRHDKVDESVCHVLFAADSKFDPPTDLLKSGDGSDFGFTTGDFPAKNAGCWFVADYLSNFVCRQIGMRVFGTSRHCAPLFRSMIRRTTSETVTPRRLASCSSHFIWGSVKTTDCFVLMGYNKAPNWHLVKRPAYVS